MRAEASTGMSATELTQPQTPDFSRPSAFGPIAVLIVVPAVALLALTVSVLLAVAASGLLAPEGPVAFLRSLLGEGTLVPDSVSLQRMDGFMFLFWGPVASGLAIAVVALRRRASIRDALAIGGTLPGRVLSIAAVFAVTMIAAQSALASIFPQLQELFTLPTEPLAMALAVTGAVIGAPVSEELLFRGLMYTALRERWGYPAALVISSAAFAGMHFDPTGVYALLVLPSALLLGWLREKTGGIYAPILMHAAFNAVAVGTLLLERTTTL